jgi:hypothetical protein
VSISCFISLFLAYYTLSQAISTLLACYPLGGFSGSYKFRFFRLILAMFIVYLLFLLRDKLSYQPTGFDHTLVSFYQPLFTHSGSFSLFDIIFAPFQVRLVL